MDFNLGAQFHASGSQNDTRNQNCPGQATAVIPQDFRELKNTAWFLTTEQHVAELLKQQETFTTVLSTDCS